MKEILTRVNLYLLLTVLVVIVFYFAKTLLVPFIFACMLAMLMAPLARKFDSWGFHRALSSFSCVFILILVILLMFGVIGAQVASFSKDAPKIKEKAVELVAKAQGMIEEKFNIPKERQENAAKEQIKKSSERSDGKAMKILSSITSTLAGLVLTLVITFLLLFNKEQYEKFFLKLYSDEDPHKVKTIVNKITEVSQKYLTGRAISILIIFALYSIGLLIVGVKNALLLAGVAALLTLIPYIGTILGGLFPMLMALVTEDSLQPALMAGVVLVVIQTLDNYFIEPNVVGGNVNLGALPTILGIISGGLIWGAAGMILFIPMLGIAKIIFDHVESLQPYGYVIGEPGGDKPSKIKEWLKEKFGKGKSSNKR